MNDISLKFKTIGSGAPIVFLHGNGESKEYFENQFEDFSKHFTVFAIDTRGHGESPRGEKPFTIRRFVEDLNEFFIEQGLEKAHVLGFSDGANVAMEFAAKYPEKVDKLVLNGGNLSPKGVKRSVQLPIEIGYKIALRSAKKSDEAKKNAELLGLMVNEPDVTDEELKKITAKTLVIAGTRDMIKPSHTKELASKINGAKLVFIKGNHFIANKNPAEFNAAVLDFLLS